MDEDAITNSPLFKKLLADAPNIEEDFRIFKARFGQFIRQDDHAVSVILRCHLIIEHFIDEYLRAANPAITTWDRLRLSMHQKLVLADNPRSVFQVLMPSLRALNTLRNKVAHRLEATFESDDIAPIRELMTLWLKAAGKAPDQLDDIELLLVFTEHASAWIFGQTCMIERHAKEHGLPGLLDWQDEGLG